MNSKVIRYIGMLFFFSMPYWLNAQTFVPYIKNYSKDTYKGESQVWSIQQGEDQAIYFANNRYFLRFNGVSWNKYTLPSKTIIRSVYALGDTIYTGSFKEFGYWLRQKGEMHYYSLSDQFKDLEFKAEEEIWKIFQFKQAIYFQSFNRLYEYNEAKIRSIDMPAQISYSYKIADKLYIATVDKGIYQLKNGVVKPFLEDEEINKKVIHGINEIEGRLWIFTLTEGIYILQDGLLQAFNHPLNELLKRDGINSILQTATHIYIGTSRRGIYAYNLLNKKIYNINRSTGLHNNTVLSMSFDAEGNIWAGMENGISRIEVQSPITLFIDSENRLGQIFQTIPYQSGYLLASHHGMFQLKNDELTKIPHTDGEVRALWALNEDEIIFNHNRLGTYRYREQLPIEKISDVLGGWKIKEVAPNYFMQSTYYGFYLYKKKNGHIAFDKKVEKLNRSINNFFEYKKGVYWATDFHKGVHKITFSDAFDSILEVEDMSSKSGIVNDYKSRILPINQTFRFLIQERWYHYNPITDSLEQDDTFNNIIGEATDLVPLTDSSFLIQKEQTLHYIVLREGKPYWHMLPEKYYSGRLVDEEFDAFMQGNNLIVNLEEGLLQYIINNQNKPTENQEISIEAFWRDKWIENNEHLRPNRNNIAIQIITGKFGFENQDLYYSFNDSEKKSLTEQFIQFENLASDDYVFTVYKPNGKQWKELKKFYFVLDAPFYRSKWMIVMTLGCFLTLWILYFRHNKRKYFKKLQLQEERLRYEKELIIMKLKMENEKNIVQLEQEKLQQKIKNKTTQVAGKALTIAKQGEILDKITYILKEGEELDAVRRKVTIMIKDHLDQGKEMKVFDQSIYEVHQDFIEKLKLTYPKLTPKDIKLCIFLKMGMSSKEIAPLFNISYRSVELSRYRLRKKMNLIKDENLNEVINAL